jgi:hypothetical protein
VVLGVVLGAVPADEVDGAGAFATGADGFAAVVAAVTGADVPAFSPGV